jgi:ribosomal-protein-alanine N-acetyltransferase
MLNELPSEILQIGPMTPADLDAVCDIDRLCFPTPWSRGAFETELRNAASCYVVARLPEPTGRVRQGPGTPDELGSRVVGFAGMWVMVDEAHITTMAVHPEHRRKKIGEALLVHLLRTAFQRGATRATLEVRAGNAAAQRLYEKYGFVTVAYLQGYYSDTGEDGHLMWLNPLEAEPRPKGPPW